MISAGYGTAKLYQSPNQRRVRRAHQPALVRALAVSVRTAHPRKLGERNEGTRLIMENQPKLRSQLPPSSAHIPILQARAEMIRNQ